MSVSGYGTEFTFLGFLPVKGSERSAKLSFISDSPHAVVFFESPHRILSTASEIVDQITGELIVFNLNETSFTLIVLFTLGARSIVMCRELTKVKRLFKFIVSILPPLMYSSV